MKAKLLKTLQAQQAAAISRHGHRDEQGLGTCHAVAYETMLYTCHALDDCVNLYLVEGECFFSKPQARGSHAWLEVDGPSGTEVMDSITGRVMDKKSYYDLGQVTKVSRYTEMQAIDLGLENGHYGPFSPELQ
jgi:hypothetical protein